MRLATRTTKRSKRLASGKRRSSDGHDDDADDEDKDGETAQAGKKRKATSYPSDEGDPRGAETMAVLQGSDRLFAGLRKGARGLRASAARHGKRGHLAPTARELDHFTRNLLQFDPSSGPREQLLQVGRYTSCIRC